MKNHEKLSNRIMIAVFVLFIFGFAIAGIISRDREFSEMENRPLAQFPEFSFKALKSGDYTADIESYMSDQVFLKDKLVTLKTDCERAVLKNCQNGVYLGHDGYYIQQYIEDKKKIDNNVFCVNDWVKAVPESVTIDFILVPNAVSVMEDKLPDFAVNDEQLDSIKHIKDTLEDRVNLFCAYDTLKAKVDNGEQVFYKTDHHWNDNGAKATFEAYLQSKGEKLADVSYDKSIKREDFYGTLYSKAPSELTKPDTMILPVSSQTKHTVEYVKEDKTIDSIIDESFLNKKDKYAAFLGGNFSRVNIKTKNAKSDEKVLILKDSYANSMIPYLANQYSELTVVDMRYYHFEEQTVSELVENEGIDRVIMIYNMDFINSDENFMWLE